MLDKFKLLKKLNWKNKTNVNSFNNVCWNKYLEPIKCPSRGWLNQRNNLCFIKCLQRDSCLIQREVRIFCSLATKMHNTEWEVKQPEWIGPLTVYISCQKNLPMQYYNNHQFLQLMTLFSTWTPHQRVLISMRTISHRPRKGIGIHQREIQRKIRK